MQEDLAMGGNTNIHDAMIAAEKASLSMQMAIQVRNRILAAYTEITSMGV
jgi:flagellar hook-basal body complex protein FliE